MGGTAYPLHRQPGLRRRRLSTTGSTPAASLVGQLQGGDSGDARYDPSQPCRYTTADNDAGTNTNDGGGVVRLIIHGPEHGSTPEREIELRRGELVIGRAGEADLEIDNPTVSRRHAAIACTTQGYVLTDLGSANGTWVNGNRITRRVLRHEDQIRFGAVVVVFDEPPDPGATMMVDVGRLLDEVPAAPAAVANPAASAPAAASPPAPPAAPSSPPRAAAAATPHAQRIAIKPDPPAVGIDLGDHPLERSPPPRAVTHAPEQRPKPPDRPLARTISTASAWPYAGFWIRVLAALLDGFVLALGGGFLWGAATVAARLLARLWPAAPVVLIPAATAIAGLLSLAYVLVGWTRFGRTLGKLACHLRVVREDGRTLGLDGAVIRLLGYLASSLPLGTGYLIVAFTDRKRGLHDMIAGTVVVRE